MLCSRRVRTLLLAKDLLQVCFNILHQLSDALCGVEGLQAQTSRSVCSTLAAVLASNTCQTRPHEMEHGLALAACWRRNKVWFGRSMWQGQLGPGMPRR